MMSNKVAIQDLRVGMFIHLDLGWMSHPFPLSSFRISSAEQITTIRGLGLQSVRWAPEKSDVAAPAAAAAVPARPALTVVETAEQVAARERRDLLAVERAARQQCEQQYAEAGRDWRAAWDAVAAAPKQAREHAENLTRALVDKLLVEGEMCVRVLSAQSGDRAGAHAMNVAVISLLMGRGFGLSPEEMQDLGVGALLHDVGKLDVAERVRHTDERHTAAEVAAYREHVSLGLAQGRRLGLSQGAMLIIAQHHESADGSGWPLKLNADRMSTAARIVSIVDRYDNLCNPAVSSRALTPHESLSMLFAQTRSKFDTTILNAFIRMMGVYPAGSVVQLTDDRYAMVTTVNSSRPLKPRVMVHDPKVPREEALMLNLETMPDLGIRRSLNPNKLPTVAFDYLLPRPRVAYFFEALPVEEMAA